MSKKVADLVLGVRTMADVNGLLAEAGKAGFSRWIPVGNRENNTGTIRVASDPGLAIVERVTNGIDALLELGRLEAPGATVSSPREAARLWYKVPKGGIAEMDEASRRALAARLNIELAESGDKKRPTVIVVDQGIGQLPSRFPKTLLSLNESNKRSAMHLMGAYGQGGAATFGFSRATVIVSRRHPSHRDGADDEVGWTVVMEQFDPKTEKFPSYKYLVGKDGEVPSFVPSMAPSIGHGTRITHVAYDLQGLTAPFTALRGGLWQFMHAALFDPVLPFLVSGSRANEVDGSGKPQSRVVIGNAARLQNREDSDGEGAQARKAKQRGSIELKWSDSHRYDLSAQGAVTLNYWALVRKEGSDSTEDPAGSYVRADSAVVMTVFGQRQDAESRIWIKDHAKLPFLYKNLVIQIDADELSGSAKSELFASTRERATNSEIKDRIYDYLAEILREDENLKALNREEKERLLRKSTTATSQKIQQRLAKFVKTKLKGETKPGKGAGKGDGGGANDADGKDSGKRKSPPSGGTGGRSDAIRNTDDAHLHKVPTKLKFTRARARIHQGGRAFVWVEIDAKNGYLPEHDGDLTIWLDDSSVKATTRSKLLGGRARWGFEADPSAPRKRVKCRAELMTPNGLLFDEVDLEVVEAPVEEQPNTGGAEEPTGPRIEWKTKDAWDEDWDGRTVGAVDEDEETIIWVNKDLNLLVKAMSGAALTPDQVVTRQDRYLFPIACALWLQEDERKRLGTGAASDDWRKREMERVAEAVLLAIDPDADAAKDGGGEE